jgi:hypothetical protein
MTPRRRRLYAVFAAIAGVLLCACRRDYESEGPTENFRALDVNHDGDIDRFEWENQHESAIFPDTLSFRYMDCDRDGRVTWHEYAEGQMHGKHCPGPYLYEATPWPPPPEPGIPAAEFSHEDDTLSEDWREAPLLARTDERVGITPPSPGIPVVPLHWARAENPRPSRYSEVDLPSNTFRTLHLSSLPLGEDDLLANDDGEPARKTVHQFVPHFQCELANGSNNTRVTLADIQVVWRIQGRVLRARWLKSVWIDPGATQDFDVWFAGNIDAAECRLLHARGQILGGGVPKSNF